MNAMRRTTNALNIILTSNDKENAAMYKIRDTAKASPGEMSPRIIGRYGFDILSALMSVTWFNAFDAPFNMARAKLAGIIVVSQNVERSSVTPL